MSTASTHPAGPAGRRGDFITSPEVGPLFGAVVARALDTWWREVGEPDPFVVVEAGAGPGTLCRTVLAASPACAPALRYVLVERSARCANSTGDRLSLEQPSHCVRTGPRRRRRRHRLGSPRRSTRWPDRGQLSCAAAFDGPGASCWPTSCSTTSRSTCYERRAGRWHEVRVGVDVDASTLVEAVVPIADEPPELEGVEAPMARGRRCSVRGAVGARRARPGEGRWSRRRVRLRPPQHGRVSAARGATGCARTAPTSAAPTRSPIWARRTSPSRSPSTSSRPRRPSRRKPTGCAPTASTSWSPKPAGTGTSAPPSATWPR